MIIITEDEIVDSNCGVILAKDEIITFVDKDDKKKDADDLKKDINQEIPVPQIQEVIEQCPR